jgi:hypothetical protein
VNLSTSFLADFLKLVWTVAASVSRRRLKSCLVAYTDRQTDRQQARARCLNLRTRDVVTLFCNQRMKHIHSLQTSANYHSASQEIVGLIQ